MYGGQCTEPFFNSVMRTLDALRGTGIQCDWLSEKNESLIHRGRMEMLATFLYDTDYSHLFWIDADIEFKPEDVAALWNLGVDISCGVYRMKKADARWYSAWRDGRLVELSENDTEPFPVDYCGTGFLLISRKATEAIMADRKRLYENCKAFIEEIFTHREGLSEERQMFLQGMLDHFAPDWEGKNGRRVPSLFMTPIFNDGLESEDYAFCRLAREAGFSIMMHPQVKLAHWGNYKYA